MRFLYLGARTLGLDKVIVVYQLETFPFYFHSMKWKKSLSDPAVT